MHVQGVRKSHRSAMCEKGRGSGVREKHVLNFILDLLLSVGPSLNSDVLKRNLRSAPQRHRLDLGSSGEHVPTSTAGDTGCVRLKTPLMLSTTR